MEYAGLRVANTNPFDEWFLSERGTELEYDDIPEHEQMDDVDDY